MLRILIADDSAIVRKALRVILERNPELWTICGEAIDGEDTISLTERLLPDVVLLDLSMPVIHGIKVAGTLKRLCPQVRIVILSEDEEWLLHEIASALDLKYVLSKSAAASGLKQVLCDLQDEIGRPGNRVRGG
jgi:DNA-binding NarL/FixJ family response regulator